MNNMCAVTTSYNAEYLAGEEIAKLLSKIDSADNRAVAKAQIKSFLEGFIARDTFCDEAVPEEGSWPKNGERKPT